MTTTVTQTQSLAQFAPGLAATGKTPAQIMSAARDFESVFATQMLTPMYEGMDVDPMFGGGHGEEMFRTMMLDEYGKQIGKNDSFGLVRSISDVMLKAQEGKH